MKLPGPDHSITISPSAAGQRWRVLFHGHEIADSADAVVLEEASYPPVVYFPRADVRMEYLSRTDHRTHCPYKGDASYFTLHRDGEVVDNAVWSYETPFPAMARIEGRLAFYPQHVEIFATREAGADAGAQRVIDQAVLHTDSGSGTSQREHWPPNVPGPDGGVT